MNNRKTVRIRKPHLCFSCHRRFIEGTEMSKWSCIYEGEFCYGYTCSTCEEIHDSVPRWWVDDGIPDGFVAEALKTDETPEQYLERIKQ